MDITGNVVGSFEGKTRFAELVAAAEHGEETTILRNGKPVAKIVPYDADAAWLAKREKAIDQLRAAGKAIVAKNGGPISREEILAGIREGRRWLD